MLTEPTHEGRPQLSLGTYTVPSLRAFGCCRCVDGTPHAHRPLVWPRLGPTGSDGGLLARHAARTPPCCTSLCVGHVASAHTRCCSCCCKPSHDCRLQRRHRPRRLTAWHRCVAVNLICGVTCCSALWCAPPRAFGMPVADCAEAAIMAIGFDIALGESRRPWFYNSTAAPCVASHPRLCDDDHSANMWSTSLGAQLRLHAPIAQAGAAATQAHPMGSKLACSE